MAPELALTLTDGAVAVASVTVRIGSSRGSLHSGPSIVNCPLIASLALLADLMRRNLEHRVELAVPIEDPELRTQVLDTVALCLADNHNAWDLDSDGTWTRRTPASPDAAINAQEQLMRHAGLA